MLQEDEASAAQQPENSCTHTSLLLSAPLLRVPALKIYPLRSKAGNTGPQGRPPRPLGVKPAEGEAGLLSRLPPGASPSGSLKQSWQAWQARVKERRREGGRKSQRETRPGPSGTAVHH